MPIFPVKPCHLLVLLPVVTLFLLHSSTGTYIGEGKFKEILQEPNRRQYNPYRNSWPPSRMISKTFNELDVGPLDDIFFPGAAVVWNNDTLVKHELYPRLIRDDRSSIRVSTDLTCPNCRSETIIDGPQLSANKLQAFIRQSIRQYFDNYPHVDRKTGSSKLNFPPSEEFDVSSPEQFRLYVGSFRQYEPWISNVHWENIERGREVLTVQVFRSVYFEVTAKPVRGYGNETIYDPEFTDYFREQYYRRVNFFDSYDGLNNTVVGVVESVRYGRELLLMTSIDTVTGNRTYTVCGPITASENSRIAGARSRADYVRVVQDIVSEFNPTGNTYSLTFTPKIFEDPRNKPHYHGFNLVLEVTAQFPDTERLKPKLIELVSDTSRRVTGTVSCKQIAVDDWGREYDTNERPTKQFNLEDEGHRATVIMKPECRNVTVTAKNRVAGLVWTTVFEDVELRHFPAKMIIHGDLRLGPDYTIE